MQFSIPDFSTVFAPASAGAKGANGVQSVAISGAGGLVGKRLTAELTKNGVTVTPIATNYRSGDFSPIDLDALEGVDVVIHLAGENVASGEGPLGILGRWSDSKKAKIMESRVEGTAAIVDAMSQLKRKPKAFITASGVGYYGYKDFDQTFTESSARGEGFLADVCERWEAETQRAASLGIKTSSLRFGVILSPLGGAVAKLFPLFFLGGGGVLGSGDQPFSWVTLKDAVRAIQFVAEKKGGLTGPINVTAPAPCTNADFTRALGEALGRPTIFPLPEAVGNILFGQMGQEMLFGGQRAMPGKLTKAGFDFEDTDIFSGVKACLADK